MLARKEMLRNISHKLNWPTRSLAERRSRSLGSRTHKIRYARWRCNVCLLASPIECKVPVKRSKIKTSNEPRESLHGRASELRQCNQFCLVRWTRMRARALARTLRNIRSQGKNEWRRLFDRLARLVLSNGNKKFDPKRISICGSFKFKYIAPMRQSNVAAAAASLLK